MAPLVPSTALKLTQIVFAVFFCLTCAGVIFGFAALKPVLVAEGVYSDYCEPGERRRDAETGAWRVCDGQDTRLNLAFTIAAGVTNIACLPIGYTLDTLGPKKTSILGAVLFAIGNFLFGLGYRSTWMDTYILGFVFLALGGPLIFLPSFHLSNAFPAYSGIILSAVIGAFDASSLPYVFYRMAYDATDGRLTRRIFFFGYLILPVIVILEQLFVAPSTIYSRVDVTAGADEETPAARPELTTNPSSFNPESSQFAMTASAFSRIHYGDDHDDEEGMVNTHSEKDPIVGTLYGQSAWEQMSSSWYFVLAAFVCIHMLRVNYYILSCFSQLEHYTGDAISAESLTKIFTLLLPLGGFVGIPLVGFLLDYRPWLDVGAVLAAMGLLFGILGTMPSFAAQVAGIVFFCLFRPLMYTSVSDAFAKIFGFQTFGTVYGSAMTLSGLVGLANAPLDVFVKTTMQSNFLPVDITLVVLGFLSSSALIYKIRKATVGARGVQLE